MSLSVTLRTIPMPSMSASSFFWSHRFLTALYPKSAVAASAVLVVVVGVGAPQSIPESLDTLRGLSSDTVGAEEEVVEVVEVVGDKRGREDLRFLFKGPV